jgi:DNA modification methylase
MQIQGAEILVGDAATVLRTLPDESVDALVTDPPYGWRFMGKAWDGADIEKKTAERRAWKRRGPKEGPNGGHRSIAAEAGKYDERPSANKSFQEWTEEWAREVFRVLKPGAHALVFCGPRTYHRMAAGVEDAGFEIRDQIQWIFGSGFPKSLNVGKAIEGGEWNGWGTALKPANEPILLARKPLSEKTVAANVLKWGTGALNIDDSRVGTDDMSKQFAREWAEGKNAFGQARPTNGRTPGKIVPPGRFPANLVFSHSPLCSDDHCDMWDCPVWMLDQQSGVLKSGGFQRGSILKPKTAIFGGENKTERQSSIPFDAGGGASRFFYCAKASQSERNLGLNGRTPKKVNDGRDTPIDNPFQRGETLRLNTHPTVKPVKLMQYLVRLVTPPGGKILDPFVGSGTTGIAAALEGFGFLGIEQSVEYAEMAQARLVGVQTEVPP